APSIRAQHDILARNCMKRRALCLAALAMIWPPFSYSSLGAQSERARDLGIPFEGTPGTLNAITDVPGVEVGQITHLSGDGALKVGVGPIRTGVTVILPRGKRSGEPAYGGFFNLNGNGEMTGQSYLQDFGVVYGPIGISNTNAIGQVYSGIMEWSQKRFGHALWPVVAETWDGDLNDIEGFHITPQDAVDAIEAATSGPVEEGNGGGGTGMVCFGFKGGIGTASRKVAEKEGGYVVGVLVQSNFGARHQLRIAGVPVGEELAAPAAPRKESGSIIITVATDAPLLPHQLKRLARRAALGLARTGSVAGNGSGDIFLAFSTA